MEENFLKERKDLFQYLVTGSKSAAELLEMADKLNIDLSSMWYNIVLMVTKSNHHAQNEYSDSLVKIEEKSRELDDDHILIFDRNLEGKAYLFKADSKEELEIIQKDYIILIRKQI